MLFLWSGGSGGSDGLGWSDGQPALLRLVRLAEAHLAARPAVVADRLLAAVLGAGVAEREVAGEMLAADIARAAGRRGLALRKIRVQVGARHAVELAFVFQNPQETIFTGKPADPALTKMVGDMWTNFARTGNPSVPGFGWPAYEARRRMTAILNRSPHVKSDPLKAQRELLTPLIRHIINASYESMNYNVPFVLY